MPDGNNSEVLFTIVMEYAGTTSVSQVVAADAKKAMSQWMLFLENPESLGLTRKQADRVRKAFLPLETPVALDGAANVWCATGSTNKGLVLVNIVLTLADLE